MNGDTVPDYDEIRREASKNWLSAASVSLAKLDEVKARVYNIGLNDARNLKPTPRAAGQVKQGQGRATRWASAAPPLSGVNMQNNAWGTVASVPENAVNIRDECGKRTFRTRPVSAKSAGGEKGGQSLRRRPHSATITGQRSAAGREAEQDLLIEEDLLTDHLSTGLGVHGARFAPGERPENYSQHGGTVGYVAPSDDTRTGTEEANINHFLDYNSIIHIPGDGEMDAPPAPSSSPVPSQSQDNTQRLDYAPLMTPKYPINLTMPNPAESYASDDEGENNGRMKVNITISNVQSRPQECVRGALIGSDGQTREVSESGLEQNYPEDELGQNVPESMSTMSEGFSELSEELKREVEDLKRDLKSNAHRSANILGHTNTGNYGIRTRPKSGKNRNVNINEKNNFTVDITPRHQTQSEGSSDNTNSGSGSGSVKSRPSSGRRDLRHVKSRTDSGYVPRTNSEQTIHTGLRSRPQSAKVSTLTVAFGDDSENESEAPPCNGKMVGKLRRSNSASQDVDTFMSRLSVDGNRGQDVGEEESPGSRVGEQAKIYSSSQKNYYEVAMSGPSAKTGVAESACDGKEIRKTVKTLELLEGQELKEMKLVSVIGKQEPRVSEYVAPRPPSAKFRPHSAKTGAAATSKQPGTTVRPASSHHASRTAAAQQARVAPEPLVASQASDDLHPVTTAKPPVFKPRTSQSRDTSKTKPPTLPKTSDAILFDLELENHDPFSKPEPRSTEQRKEPEPEPRPGSRLGFRVEDEIQTAVGIQKRATSTPVIRGIPQQRPACGCAHTDMPGSRSTKSPGKAGRGGGKATLRNDGSASSHSSITDLMAKPENFSGYGNLTGNKLDAKTKKHNTIPSVNVVEITTRKQEFEYETDGVKECRELQDKLYDKGLHVNIDTLERALLPPTEYRWSGPSYKSNVTPNHPEFKNTSSGLLTKPETWLRHEYKKIRDAEMRVEIATSLLEEQRREEEEGAEERRRARKTKKKGRKSKESSKHNSAS